MDSLIKSRYKEIMNKLKIIYNNLDTTKDINLITNIFSSLYTEVKELTPYLSESKYCNLVYKLRECENRIDRLYILNTKAKYKDIFDDFYSILDLLIYECRLEISRVYWEFSNEKYEVKTFDDIDVTNMCRRMSYYLKCLCDKCDIPCQVIRINPGFSIYDVFDNGGFHYFCIVTLRDKQYLMDPTYKQFFSLSRNIIERMGVKYLTGCYPGIYMIQNESRLDTANQLLNKGYVELDDINTKNYFDGFALSYRNGLFYEDKGVAQYETRYSSSDYLNFINGRDEQIRYEPTKFLNIQEKTLKNSNFKY